MKEANTFPALPFPPINWWKQGVREKVITLDISNIYQKKHPQNRYTLTGSQGKQLLSIPLSGGRNQKIKIEDVTISYAEDWQSHHWKTIQTLYQRSPFFEFYAADIEPLFKKKLDKLFDWNKQSITAIISILKLDLQLRVGSSEEGLFPQLWKNTENVDNHYHQVFHEKTGFQANCSVLDLIFCEGNHAVDILFNER